ncbi:hypothetical protein FOA43_004029 [Brettanomyces nanus]|uniref:Uncharacterized protein n=1 Tax=Eeniella nana TaxID=13502 RepID=A0A875RX20_EENNA|nr:uncharacterized protein FOA43_004029 [Brettanomyces nanus]QPG76637.1 hypothetical protein FOA43_004029 [Brettanomyces nanus]
MYVGCRNGIEVIDLRTFNRRGRGRRSALKIDNEQDQGEISAIELTPYEWPYKVVCGTSNGFLQYYDVRNGRKLTLDVGYMYGGKYGIEISEVRMCGEYCYLMIEEERGSSKVVEINAERVGNEIVREYDWEKMTEEKQERYRTQFAVIEGGIMVGSGLPGGEVVVMKNGEEKKISFGKEVVSRISYRGEVVVVGDDTGWVYPGAAE